MQTALATFMPVCCWKVSLSQQREKEKRIAFKNLFQNSGTWEFYQHNCLLWNTLQCLKSSTIFWSILPGRCDFEDAKFIDETCNWSAAKNLAQWWARCDHLKMLSKSFSAMMIDKWQACPSSTNAVERRNKDCKSDSPQCLKLSMIKVYKIDKLA